MNTQKTHDMITNTQKKGEREREPQHGQSGPEVISTVVQTVQHSAWHFQQTVKHMLLEST